MKPSSDCINLIKAMEGLRLEAYPDPATGGEPWTIGYGSVAYPDGKPVKLGHVITMQRAEDLLKWEVEKKAMAIGPLLLNTKINQSQFDALCSFCYNVGFGNLKSSTLLKKVRNNPDDPSIKDEFLKWNKANNKVMEGLTRRRMRECSLYFKSST
jgi:lysozyme